MSAPTSLRGTLYVAWSPQRGEAKQDGRLFRCASPDAAARAWAENEDARFSEYLIARGHAVEVAVAELHGQAPEQRFTVRGSARPVYFAHHQTGIAAHPLTGCNNGEQNEF
jgi:hypothetical protein